MPMDKDTATKTYDGIKDFMDGWKFNEDYTRLYRCFYAKDYLLAVQFMREIAKMDALTYKNHPSFTIQAGDFVKVELYSAPLNGLSQVDFKLAMEINRLKFDEFSLIPVKGEKNYRREGKLKIKEKESEEIQKILAESFNIGGKAKSSDAEQHQQSTTEQIKA